MNKLPFAVLGVMCWAWFARGTATPWAADPLAEQLAGSSAVLRGTVLGTSAHTEPDGHIYTRTRIRVEEVFKGNAPQVIELAERGGSIGGRGEVDGASCRFAVGEERLLFLVMDNRGGLSVRNRPAGAPVLAPARSEKLRTADATWAEAWLADLRLEAAGGPLPGADLPEASDGGDPGSGSPGADFPAANALSLATNLLTGTDGIGARFLAPDRGEAIPCLVDVDYLPSGITQDQALSAVQAALDAWSQVTSLEFRIAGLQSFGMAASDVASPEGVLYIQLHDHYQATAGGNELGLGGLAWTTQVIGPGWTTGGNVKGNDFHQAVKGYVMLQHTNRSMRDLSMFTEVLTHEIGHAVGLGHSSENPNEPNPEARQAIMYYTAHGDGRGARLNDFDIAVCRQVHPQDNTPPFGYSRVLDAVTTPEPISVPGINEVELRGYDLQDQSLNLQTYVVTNRNGVFTASGNVVHYTPNSFFSDSGRLDPASNKYYDNLFARFSDGLNASPFVTLRVLSFNADSYSEGVPDHWRVTYFGDANPAAGARRHAEDDYDSDGFTNLDEYRMGSNPADRESNLSLAIAGTGLTWVAKPFELYEIHATTNFATWTSVLPAVLPTNTPASTSVPLSAPGQFFRLEKVP